MPNTGIQAGWYPDPQDSTMVRWWDGAQWSSQTQFASPNQTVAPHRRIFGGKRELEDEVERLNAVVEGMGINEREALRAELARLNVEIPGLRYEESTLLASVLPLRAEVAVLSGVRGQGESLRSEVAELKGRRDVLMAETTSIREMLSRKTDLDEELNELQQQVVETRDTAILQEVGVYQFRHPLDDAPSYKARLLGMSAQIKDAVKAGNAVVGSTNWTVNGSKPEGNKMVREFSKLMLRAYNNEADNAVRSMRPYALDSAISRLTKAKETISKLGKTMSIVVTDQYHSLRISELELTADFLAKVADEKERDRERRVRLREEEVARREFERAQDRLRKEKAHYEEAVVQLRANGDDEAANSALAKLGEVSDALEGVIQRAANIRTGHVYVISNVGAFGPDVVKIGMTRRLEPTDRIRELGDASVPFHYDLHAMVFSDDAVSLEHQLHEKFADCRLNLVNMRREFFRTQPTKVRDILLELDASIVTWTEDPEALEWRQSETTRKSMSSAAKPSSGTVD